MMRPVGRPWLAPALLAGALFLAACDSTPEDRPAPAATSTVTPSAAAPDLTAAPSTTPSAPAARTEIVRYVPARPDTSTTQQGACFARSLALQGREDVYRCSVGNRIHDPCFALADGALVCGADPTNADAQPFLLRVATALPSQPPNTAQVESANRNAWLVTLADGTVCGFLTGATAGFDGQRINYGCTDRTSILGDLVPGTPWTARFVTGSMGPNGFVPSSDVVKPLATVYQ